MTYLGIDEMDVVLREMSDEEIKQILTDLQAGYRDKRISLGHALTEEQETGIRDDMLTDNLLYMKALKEIKDRHERMASEAWRRFDDEADEFIRKVQQQLSDNYWLSGD